MGNGDTGSGVFLGEKLVWEWLWVSAVDAGVAEENENFLRRAVVVVHKSGERSEFAVIWVLANMAGYSWWDMRLGHKLR